MRTLRALPARTAAAARRRPRWWLELVLVALLLFVYDLVTNLAPLRRAAAIRHGRDLLRIEHSLHLSPERSLDRWLSHHHGLALALADVYDNAHFVVTFGVLLWLWIWHSDRYVPLRRALVLTNLLAFAVFLLYPTAPPRLLPGQGYIDVVAQTGAIGSWHTGALSHDADQYAAMPSLHLAWAWWSVISLALVVRGRLWRGLFGLYPLLVGFVVLSTGNHYLIDAVAGSALAFLSVWLGRREPRTVPAVRRLYPLGLRAVDGAAGVWAMLGPEREAPAARESEA
ncbi:MAG TPA: phosphatase PAP2 family protein [Solirubrobacteraceae bacterium]|nr:phosphatase PAP2 family protein [Solirubrobacteraceae bacterium]